MGFKIANLSSGTRQKLLLLPIFVISFDLIILDETFKNIDDQMVEKYVAKIISQYENQAAIIIVEHLIDIAKIFSNYNIVELKCQNSRLEKL